MYFLPNAQTTKIKRLENISPVELSKYGVIGGGTMGAGICAAMLLSGKPVVMLERDEVALGVGMDRVKSILQTSLKRQVINDSLHDKILASFLGHPRISRLGRLRFDCRSCV